MHVLPYRRGYRAARCLQGAKEAKALLNKFKTELRNSMVMKNLIATYTADTLINEELRKKDEVGLSVQQVCVCMCRHASI